MISTIQEEPAPQDSPLVSFHSYSVSFSTTPRTSNPHLQAQKPFPLWQVHLPWYKQSQVLVLCLLFSAFPCSSQCGGKGYIEEMGLLI